MLYGVYLNAESMLHLCTLSRFTGIIYLADMHSAVAS